jgi:hypothetical protein
MLPDQRVQPGHSSQAFVQPGPAQPTPGGVHHLHIVVILGPVISDEQHTTGPQPPVCATCHVQQPAGENSAT